MVADSALGISVYSVSHGSVIGGGRGAYHRVPPKPGVIALYFSFGALPPIPQDDRDNGDTVVNLWHFLAFKPARLMPPSLRLAADATRDSKFERRDFKLGYSSLGGRLQPDREVGFSGVQFGELTAQLICLLTSLLIWSSVMFFRLCCTSWRMDDVFDLTAALTSLLINKAWSHYSQMTMGCFCLEVHKSFTMNAWFLVFGVCPKWPHSLGWGLPLLGKQVLWSSGLYGPGDNAGLGVQSGRGVAFTTCARASEQVYWSAEWGWVSRQGGGEGNLIAASGPCPIRPGGFPVTVCGSPQCHPPPFLPITGAGGSRLA